MWLPFVRTDDDTRINGARHANKRNRRLFAPPPSLFALPPPLFTHVACAPFVHTCIVCARQAQRIVVYHRKPHLVHLNTRVQETGEELYSETISGVPRPAVVNVGIAASLDSLQLAANQLSSQGEGFVVRDGAGRRIKIKSSEYLRAHRAEDRLNKNIWFHVASAFISPGRLTHSMEWRELLPRGFSSCACEQFFESTMASVCGAQDANHELTVSQTKREIFEAVVFGGVEEMKEMKEMKETKDVESARGDREGRWWRHAYTWLKYSVGNR